MSVMEAIGFNDSFLVNYEAVQENNKAKTKDRRGRQEEKSKKAENNQTGRQARAKKAGLKNRRGKLKGLSKPEPNKLGLGKVRVQVSKLSLTPYSERDLERLIFSEFDVDSSELCAVVWACSTVHFQFLKPALQRVCTLLESRRTEVDPAFIDTGLLVLTAAKLSTLKCESVIPLRNRFVEGVVNYFLMHSWKFQLWSMVSIVSTIHRCHLRFSCVSHRLLYLLKHRRLHCTPWERLLLYQLIKKDLET